MLPPNSTTRQTKTLNETFFFSHFLQQFEFVKSFAQQHSQFWVLTHTRTDQTENKSLFAIHQICACICRGAVRPCHVSVAPLQLVIYHFRLWHGNVGAAAVTFLSTSSVILIHDHDKNRIMATPSRSKPPTNHSNSKIEKKNTIANKNRICYAMLETNLLRYSLCSCVTLR